MANKDKPDTPLQLCYDQPAVRWVAALPVGNGKLGAMIYGGVPAENIQFNEDSVWKGKPHSYAHAEAHAHFPALRQMMLDVLEYERQEQWPEAKALQMQAQDLAAEVFMSRPLGQMPYQPTGDLYIDFDHQTTVEVNIEWNEGQLERATVLAKIGGPCTVRAQASIIVLCNGEQVQTREIEPGILGFHTEAGSLYALSPS